MLTQTETKRIVEQINEAFSRLEKRVVKLEEAHVEPTTPATSAPVKSKAKVKVLQAHSGELTN